MISIFVLLNMYHSILHISLAALLLPLVDAKAHVTSQSQEFPKGAGPENLVLRPSGEVLVAIGTLPRIYQVGTTPNASPKLVHEFQYALGVSSIAPATEPDVFFAICGNFSFDTFQPTPASYIIHRLSFDHHDKLAVKELAVLDAISQPNGMLHVPKTPFVLIAECNKGFIFRFNTQTSELTTYFNHPLLKPTGAGGLNFGVNGLKFSNGYLYFSNTNQELVARIRATGLEDHLEGSPEVIATQAPVDDFNVNSHNGDLFLAYNGDNALAYLAHDGNTTVPKVTLGGGDSNDTKGATAAIWAKGAEGRELLLSVTGGFGQYASHEYVGGARIETVRVGEYL